jgi:hypothetical protein
LETEIFYEPNRKSGKKNTGCDFEAELVKKWESQADQELEDERTESVESSNSPQETENRNDEELESQRGGLAMMTSQVPPR